jgi:hypothetical protein
MDSLNAGLISGLISSRELAGRKSRGDFAELGSR